MNDCSCSSHRLCFISPITVRALRRYLQLRSTYDSSDFVFTSRGGEPLKPRNAVEILYRLSKKAGIPEHRRLHPYALRGLACTSWLRGGMSMESARRQLGHSQLSTVLKYAALTNLDVQREHRAAGAVERMGLE